MSGRRDPTQWIAFAEQDLLAIRNNMSAVDVPCGVVCFLAQQAAEKYLKAFLVSKGLEPERSHDLAAVLAACVKVDANFTSLEPDCVLLAPYAVAPRYPTAAGLPTREATENAVAATNRIAEFVRKCLN
jgi:HEPN domain-containing protein